jgi:hypothetical protein
MPGDFIAAAHGKEKLCGCGPIGSTRYKLTYALHRLGDISGALAAAERALSIRYDREIGALRARLLARSG